MTALCKAEHEHVGVAAPERVRARAQRQVFAEEADGHIVVAGAAGGRQRELVRATADPIVALLSSPLR